MAPKRRCGEPPAKPHSAALLAIVTLHGPQTGFLLGTLITLLVDRPESEELP